MTKNQKILTPIQKYIKNTPPEHQLALTKLYRLIKKLAPKTAEEGIKYGIPTFVDKKNLYHFAAGKNHIGFYPTPEPIVFFANELKKYKTSKGAIQFPLDKPLPVTLITKIIKRRNKSVKESS